MSSSDVPTPQAVAKRLSEWGDAPPADEQAPPREVRPLQGDLAHLLEDLAIDFPLLASIVEPSAVIRREYLAHVIQTTDGRLLTGAPTRPRDALPEFKEQKWNDPVKMPDIPNSGPINHEHSPFIRKNARK